MADPDRTSSHSVTLFEELQETPYAFDFFQAIRRLDCAHPDKPPTGQSSRAVDDPVRFGQEASVAFAPATVQSLERRAGKPPRLIQRFFGLLGPQGPMPLHFTEYVRERLRNHDDFTLLRFLDVFHHRMISFFYRAWARVRPTISFDKPESDRFADYVGSTVGLGMPSLVDRDALPDLPKFHFAGLMGCQTKHAEGLLAILSGYFRLPVQVDEFVGQWIELPTNCRCLMGLSASTLGVNTTVGSHVWDCQQKFRVILGPLDLDYYYRLLPGGSELSAEVRSEKQPSWSLSNESAAAGSLPEAIGTLAEANGDVAGSESNGERRLNADRATAEGGSSPRDGGRIQENGAGGIAEGEPAPSASPSAVSRRLQERGTRLGVSLERLTAAVRSYAGDELEWDLKLVLRKDDAPPLGLGIVGHLGWSSWLVREQLPQDPEDLVLMATQPHDHADPIEFRYVRNWNQQTLGQTRDGQYLMATDLPEDSDVAQVTVSS